jgi:hypothetical protein
MAGLAHPQGQPHEGPSCPHCSAHLHEHSIGAGIIRCPHCNGDFEATTFKPQPRRVRVQQVAAIGPIEANACANHARNAAVTACQRCGLLICALCDMNVGTGSYCPLCFDRVRAEDSIPTAAGKTRDYFAMARAAIIAGVPLLVAGPLFGILALAYLSKARAQRFDRDEDPWTGGLVIIWIFAVGEIAGGIFIDALMIAAMTGALK